MEGALSRALENNFLKYACVFTPSVKSSFNLSQGMNSVANLNSLDVLLRKYVFPHPGGPYNNTQPCGVEVPL
jgi:hypothetical protein